MADQTTNLKVLISATNQTGAAFSQLNSSLNNLRTQVLGVVAALAGGLAFRDIINSTRTWGMEVDRLRDELGGTAEEMSKLNFIAQSVGLSTDELSQTFGILNRRIADSAVEIAKGTSVFDQWNIKLLDANGGIVSFDEAMRRIKARFQEVGQGAQGSALLMDIFGRSGKQLSDFLALSNDQMKEMISTAQDFGLVLDGPGADSIEKFNRDLNRLELQMTGIKLAIGQAILPLLSAMLEKIRQAAGFFKSLGEAIGRMLGPFKEWIDKLGGVKAIADVLLIVGVALAGLAAVGALLTLIEAIGRLALLGLPLIAVAAAIVLVIDAFKEVGTTIAFIKDNWDKFVIAWETGALDHMLGPIKEILRNIPLVGSLLVGVIDVANGVFGTINGGLNDLANNFGSAFRNGVQNAMAELDALWRSFNAWLHSLPVVGGIIGAVGGAVGGAPNPSGGGGAGFDLGAAIREGIGLVPGLSQGAFIGGALQDALHNAGIPGFAGGGIALGPMLASIGEKGPEAIVPLDRAGGIGSTINVYVSGNVTENERALADMVGDVLMRRLFSQRQLSF